MRAGELDRKITIQSVTTANDSFGAPTPTWSTFADVWSKFMPIRGDEYFAAQQTNARIDGVFRIRWLDGVTEAMRIAYDGKLWDIRSIMPIGRNEGLEIYAEVKRS